jgi:hypothetical protein
MGAKKHNPVPNGSGRGKRERPEGHQLLQVWLTLLQHPRDISRNLPSLPSLALKLSYSKATKKTSHILTYPRPICNPEKGHMITSMACNQACDPLVPKLSHN